MSTPALAECVPTGNAITCYRPRGIVRRVVIKCPTCERRTPFLMRWDGAWYGVTLWCVTCLDMFMDGERLPRPFARYWKRDRAAEIKTRWDDAMLPAEYDRWTRYDMHTSAGECADDVSCDVCATPPGGAA